jgi:hypothetical protein
MVTDEVSLDSSLCICTVSVCFCLDQILKRELFPHLIPPPLISQLFFQSSIFFRSLAMLTRKLQAVGYPRVDSFSLTEEASVRDLVIWMEEAIFNTDLPSQLITTLGNALHPAWNSSFRAYLQACLCPFDAMTDRAACLDWLLREALRLVVAGETDALTSLRVEKIPGNQDVFAKIDRKSPNFHAGINKMAAMLNLPLHPDALVQLSAIENLLSKHLPSDGRKQNSKEIFSYTLDEVTLGFDQPGELFF